MLGYQATTIRRYLGNLQRKAYQDGMFAILNFVFHLSQDHKYSHPDKTVYRMRSQSQVGYYQVTNMQNLASQVLRLYLSVYQR